MKKSIIVTGLVAFLLCGNVSAQDSGFGLGIILGEPTGISAKVWTESDAAFDGALAWSTQHEEAINMHVDYLAHNFSFIHVREGSLPVYFGIGVRVKLADNPEVGIRIPLGLDYLFATAPLDIFLEIVPVLDIVPDMGFSVNAGLGMRYFF